MAMATKEQERKALAQIRKIIEGLGEESYIGIAFEGCLEDAQQNIDNDWGCSMKQRLEQARKDIAELNTALTVAGGTEDADKRTIEALKEKNDELRAALSAEQKKAMPRTEYQKLWVLVDDSINQVKENIMEAAATIAEGPRVSKKYANAVEGMAHLFSRKKHLEEMEAYLESYGKLLGFE